MPGWIGALGQQMAGNAANTALGIATQRMGANWDRRQQMRTAEQMMGLQIRGEKEMIDYTTANQLKNFSAQAEKDRLKAAGLNPALMYGGTSAGGQSAPSAPAVTGGQAGIIETGKTQGMGILTAAQLNLIRAQADNLDVNTKATETGIPNIGKTGVKIDTEVEGIKAGIKNTQAGTALTNALTRIRNIEGNVAEESQDDAIQRIHSEALKAIGEARSAMANGNVDQATQDSKIEILKQEAVGKVLENIMTGAQTENIQQNTEESKKRISKMAQDVAQGWNELSIKTKEARVDALMKEWEAQFKGHIGQWRISDPRIIARQIDEIMNLRQEDFKHKGTRENPKHN